MLWPRLKKLKFLDEIVIWHGIRVLLVMSSDFTTLFYLIKIKYKLVLIYIV
jgi:hypothetical protein